MCACFPVNLPLTSPRRPDRRNREHALRLRMPSTSGTQNHACNPVAPKSPSRATGAAWVHLLRSTDAVRVYGVGASLGSCARCRGPVGVLWRATVGASNLGAPNHERRRCGLGHRRARACGVRGRNWWHQRRRRRLRLQLTRFGAVMLGALLLCACPPADKREVAPARPDGCARMGQSCEVSPGKLGTCVEKTDCTGPACFVCQSQH